MRVFVLIHVHLQVLKNIVQTAKTCEMKAPPEMDAVRFGREGFDKVVLDTVEEVSNKCNIMQNTRALVMACASGVGKTYATQTVRWGCQQQSKADRFEVVSAYLGFNSVSRLTWGEEYYMKGGGSVEAVVLCRLLVWLTRAYKCASISELDSKGTCVQQQVVMPDVTEEALSVLGSVSGLKALRQSVTECLANLAKKVADEEGKKLVFLAVVDEGQFFDEFVPREDGKKVGARLALQCLRELQLAVHDNLVLLPICTGINPAVTLETRTEGENRVLGKEEQIFMLHNEWVKFCAHVMGKELLSELSDQQFQCFAALAWPRAREFLNMDVRTKYGVSSGAARLPRGDTDDEKVEKRARRVLKVAVDLPWGDTDAEKREKRVRRVLKAAADKQYLPMSDVPANMVRLDAVGETRPILDFASLSSIMNCLGLNKTTFRLPDSVSLNDLKGGDWGSFEKVVFNSLAIFAGLFYHKQPDPDTYLPSKPSTGVLRTWIPGGAANFVSVDTLENPRRHRHPHNTAKTALSEAFITKLELLKAKGDTVLLHCGGKSPLDFILMKVVKVEVAEVVKVAVAEVAKVNKGKTQTIETRTIAARFAEANHTDKDKTTVTKESLGQERDDMTVKALQTYNVMERCTKKIAFDKMVWGDRSPAGHTKVKLEPFKDDHFLLVTNKRVGKMSAKEAKRIMNPDTTEWLPMTQVLFGAPPTSSLLGSRPIWPALSQLSEIPRHTWSTPLPQTGARMTRYAPVLRRLCKLI